MQSSTRERGAAAVEFALVFPIFLVLVLGCVEFGFQLFQLGSAAGAAREGARAAAISEDDAVGDAEAKVDHYLTGLLPGGVVPTVNVGPLSADGRCQTGQAVVVEVTYTYSSLTSFFGSTTSARGRGEMRCGG